MTKKCFSCGFTGYIIDPTTNKKELIGITNTDENINACRVCGKKQPYWLPNQIKKILLEGNDKTLCRAIKAIYDFQTTAEKKAGATLIKNNVGFDANDGCYFTLQVGINRVSRISYIINYLKNGCIEAYNPFNHINSNSLKMNRESVRHRILRYSKQLALIATEKEKRYENKTI